MPFKQSGRIDGRKLEKGFLNDAPKDSDARMKGSGSSSIKMSSPPGTTRVADGKTQDHTDTTMSTRDMSDIPKSRMSTDQRIK